MTNRIFDSLKTYGISFSTGIVTKEKEAKPSANLNLRSLCLVEFKLINIGSTYSLTLILN